MKDVKSKGSVLGVDFLDYSSDKQYTVIKETILEIIAPLVLELKGFLNLSELLDFKHDILVDFERAAREARDELLKHCKPQEELREELKKVI
jgi:hypothetical protein